MKLTSLFVLVIMGQVLYNPDYLSGGDLIKLNEKRQDVFNKNTCDCVVLKGNKLVHIIHSSLGMESVDIPELSSELIKNGIPIVLEAKKKCFFKKESIPIARTFLMRGNMLLAFTDGSTVYRNCGYESEPYAADEVLINYILSKGCDYAYYLGSIEGNLYCLDNDGKLEFFKSKGMKIEPVIIEKGN